MTTFASRAGADVVVDRAAKQEVLSAALAGIGGDPDRVLIVPPDFTRFYSNAGELTAILYRQLSPTTHVDIVPALGTHTPMTEEQIREMFGPDIPRDRFKVHDWREGLVHLGQIPGERVSAWSEGRLDYDISVEVDRLLFEDYDLILSVGQVVPHEVVGMANYTKNILVGVGGQDTINKSHFLGAVHGMERIMGRVDTPVRRVFDYGVETFLGDLPICYALTVMDKDHESGDMVMRGLYVGDDTDTFAAAATLSQEVNLDLLDEPLDKVVVYLDPHEFKSTWLGNKSIYRTRMALADDGELIVLAPGLREFGEDAQIDGLIRRHGYRGTEATLAAVDEDPELKGNLSAAAHLIHGSSENRFSVTYCPGGGIDRADVEAVGFATADLGAMTSRYDPEAMTDGPNTMPDGERVFYISNPALGLWGLKKQF